MSKSINEIIGNDETKELRNEFRDMLNSGNCTYDDVEELLLGYGLEMDYFDQLI